MSRVRTSLVLALCLVWSMALVCANADSGPAMSCPRSHMPCCPMSGHGNAHCSTVQCAPQSFQKSEAPRTTQPPARFAGLVLPATPRPDPAPRELVSGRRWSFSVFRLKDDLRI